MSAADKREELEAAIWRRVHDSGARPVGLDRKGMSEILAAADAYATALASETLDGAERDRRAARRRDDLVTDIIAGRTS